ncbi:MAG: alpha/beta fold hydrolase [Candidatus Hodarchaeota archaeon]
MRSTLIKAGFIETMYDTGSIKMNYAEGPPNGSPLVLLPGQAGTWENYEKVMIPLSKSFHVFAVDIRGHGKTDWPTGNYTFDLMGDDMVAFLENRVKSPAVISGNSSGGLIALWIAANKPDLAKGIVLEDPPLFSADWPRIKTDSYVYQIFQITLEIVDVMKTSRAVKPLAKVLTKIERPREGTTRTRKVPYWMAYIMAWVIRKSQNSQKSRFPIPNRFKRLSKALLNYDSDFSRAFLDGRIYEGLNHEEALEKAKTPILLLHANWFRHPQYGLVGAMDDRDAEKARALAPHMIYKRVDAPHVLHNHDPGQFINLIKEFSSQFTT